jgi:hypothetical protein
MPVSFLNASFSFTATNWALAATAICRGCAKEAKATSKKTQKQTKNFIGVNAVYES